MKKLVSFLLIFSITAITLASIYTIIESDTSLYLDENTIITPIIENAEQPIKDQYIRTLKVTYKDYLDKPIKLQNGDKLYNRCSFQSQLTMYSESDSLVLNSWERMSCEIIAFFNLTQRDSEWLKVYAVKKIKIKNLTTNNYKDFNNENLLYFSDLIKKYNVNVKLD